MPEGASAEPAARRASSSSSWSLDPLETAVAISSLTPPGISTRSFGRRSPWCAVAGGSLGSTRLAPSPLAGPAARSLISDALGAKHRNQASVKGCFIEQPLELIEKELPVSAMRSPSVSPYGTAFLGDEVDPEAITDDDECRPEESLVADSSSVDCMHGSYGSSLSLHGVRVDDQSALDNSSTPSSPFDILTAQDVLPIEMARSRFLNLIVDYFIVEHVIERVDCPGSDCSQPNNKSNKRAQCEVRYEGDPMFSLPLMYIANLYETLVNDANVRLASLIGFREKSIGLALEASGGLYRKLTQKFPKKGTYSFRRRELATSQATRTKFPELVVHEEKRVRFVVINGLEIIERPNNMAMKDADWFKRLTGRNEVAVSSRDFKFYSPRHKFKRTLQPEFDIPETNPTQEHDSPLVCSSRFRPSNEIQNQHQTTSKRHMEQLENQPYLHLFHQTEDDTIQQVQHSTQFPPIHPCTCAPHLSDKPQHQQQSYLSSHIPCLQSGQGHLGGRMNILPTSPAKFCDECGSPYLRATSKFCSECGTKRLGI